MSDAEEESALFILIEMVDCKWHHFVSKDEECGKSSLDGNNFEIKARF